MIDFNTVLNGSSVVLYFYSIKGFEGLCSFYRISLFRNHVEQYEKLQLEWSSDQISMIYKQR